MLLRFKGMVKSLSHGLLDLYLVLRREEIIAKKPVQGAQQGTTRDINEEEGSIFFISGRFHTLAKFFFVHCILLSTFSPAASGHNIQNICTSLLPTFPRDGTGFMVTNESKSVITNLGNSMLPIYFQTRKQVGSSKRPSRS